MSTYAWAMKVSSCHDMMADLFLAMFVDTNPGIHLHANFFHQKLSGQRSQNILSDLLL